jgi:hypothetical protein
MLYRQWTIKAYMYFTGYAAQYTSPTGRTHQTAACFESAAQAVAYAQAVVDYLLALQERQQGILTGQAPRGGPDT